MARGEKSSDERQVKFEHPVHGHIMAIDGTWRRECIVKAVSETDATLTINGPIKELHLKEFFLLLSSTGLAYRRCSLAWVNGDSVGVAFIRQKTKRTPADNRDRFID